MYHPPAAGGKTAWGVNNTRTTDDPLELEKARKAKMEYQEREEERLNRLKDMERDAGGIAEIRRQRREGFQLARTNNDDFKRTQEDALKKMAEAREERKLEKKRLREESGLGKKKKKRKKEKQEEVASSSSEESSSEDSSSSSSESAKKEAKKEEAACEIAEQAPLSIEEQKRILEARAREREVKRKAADEAAARHAEAKRKEAEAEAQRQAEAKRKAEEAEQKKKEDAKKKLEEEAKRKEEEEEAKKKKAAEVEARKDLFAVGGAKKPGEAKAGDKGGDLMIGGFRKGQTVYASKNITVKGMVAVKHNTQGKIIGPSELNPMQRITVAFSRREDRVVGNMNCVPGDIKKTRT